MDITITQNEVLHYIELTKRKYELEFKTNYASTDEKSVAELRRITPVLARIADKFKCANFLVALFAESKIMESSEQLKKCGREDVKNAVMARTGPIYELMVSFNRLLKQNFESREDLAKLHIFINALPTEERETILESIRFGTILDPIALDCSKQMKSNLVRFLCRIGIPAYLEGEKLRKADANILNEVCVSTPSKKIWVPLEIAEKVKNNFETIQLFSARMQVINAERQLKTLTAEKEQEFIGLQQRYLVLLQERDELLKEFSKENELVYKPLPA